MKTLKTMFPTVAGLCVVIGMINFFAFLGMSSRAGGSALSGYNAEQHYYLNNKGTYTEVSVTIWQRQRLHEISLFITHPVMLLAMGYLVRQSIKTKIYRMPQNVIAQTVAQIHASGACLTTIDCAGSIGMVQASGPLIHAEVFPGSLTVKLPTLAPGAVHAAEITALREKSNWMERGVTIVHTSPQLVSPIRLRCEEDAIFRAALEQMAQTNIQTVKK